MKYQVEVSDGGPWSPVGSKHVIKEFAQENLDGPGGYREQADARGVGQLLDWRITEVED